MKHRNIMYIVISIICVVSIIIAVYYQIFAKKVVSESKANENTNIIDDDDLDDPEDLLAEFNKLFTNELNVQNFKTDDITRIPGLEDKEIIYTAYDIVQEEDAKYDINVKLPVFNLKGEIPGEFNENTQKIFADKTGSILQLTTGKYTIYSVDYVAYLNENILSLAIKSTLKEGNSAQRIIVQTYNYNIETNQRATLNEVLEAYDIDKKEVNEKIEKQVKEASKQAETISVATGQTVYKRDLSNARYITDNVTNFFIGKDGQIYIIYAYGNNNITSEIDIIKI